MKRLALALLISSLAKAEFRAAITHREKLSGAAKNSFTKKGESEA